MKKRMVLITALALCAGLLCGCGDGGPAPGSTPAEGSLPESQVSLAGGGQFPGRRGKRAGDRASPADGFLRGVFGDGNPRHLQLVL